MPVGKIFAIDPGIGSRLAAEVGQPAVPKSVNKLHSVSKTAEHTWSYE